MLRSANQSEVSLSQETNPGHFFRERVLEAQARQQIKLPDNVEFYLVSLLCDFVKAKDDSIPDSDCLALVLKRALESPHGEKVVLFKHIGDTALYVSGFFKDSFTRKAYDMKYYAMMGEGAYAQLAGLMQNYSTFGRTMSSIYSELADHFFPAVEVLMDVSEQTTGQADASAFNALNVYSQWLTTESAKLGRDLLREGIIPVPVKGRSVQ
jgi:hypothetical protein